MLVPDDAKPHGASETQTAKLVICDLGRQDEQLSTDNLGEALHIY